MEPHKHLAVLELYKAHHTAKETAIRTDLSYQTVITMFRNFKAMDIAQYNRLDLIPEETLDAIITRTA